MVNRLFGNEWGVGICQGELESTRSDGGSSIIGCWKTTSEAGGPLWKLIPARMCEKLVGLGEVDLVGINDPGEEAPLEVVIRSRKARPVCVACGGPVWSKGHRTVVLVDLPTFGRPVRLRWRKRRWTCPNPDCALRSFIEQDPTIGPQRALLTSRAARWVTVQVGGRGRTIQEVAAELGCDWHTVNKEVGRWGEALLEADTDRVGTVEAVGVDETLFWRRGRWRTKVWCTSVVDVGGHQPVRHSGG